jgi:hypothetical protein
MSICGEQSNLDILHHYHLLPYPPIYPTLEPLSQKNRHLLTHLLFEAPVAVIPPVINTLAKIDVTGSTVRAAITRYTGPAI